MNMKKGSLVTL
uniref:Uncharacterized protein n=1 Tax=Anguilla anguilla TaxID=7936 RepID=A0A0E9UHT0_ANGAN